MDNTTTTFIDNTIEQNYSEQHHTSSNAISSTLFNSSYAFCILQPDGCLKPFFHLLEPDNLQRPRIQRIESHLFKAQIKNSYKNSADIVLLESRARHCTRLPRRRPSRRPMVGAASNRSSPWSTRRQSCGARGEPKLRTEEDAGSPKT
jgi:hypothetical protein